MARYQFIAFGVAIVTALLGIIWRRDARRMLLTGFVPLIGTALAIAALVILATVLGNQAPPPDSGPPLKPTAPAADLPTPTQD